jgi:hypothetical protein
MASTKNLFKKVIFGITVVSLSFVTIAHTYELEKKEVLLQHQKEEIEAIKARAELQEKHIHSLEQEIENIHKNYIVAEDGSIVTKNFYK